MNYKLDSKITEQKLTSYLEGLSDAELKNACYAFAENAADRFYSDWNQSLQALKQMLKPTPSRVSNVNVLKQKSATELAELLLKFLKKEKFYDITMRILKVWLLSEKRNTVITFLDGADISHSDGLIERSEKCPDSQAFIRGIEDIRHHSSQRDVAIYLRFLLDLWSDSKSDDFWSKLPEAVKESGLNLDLNIFSEVSSTAEARQMEEYSNKVNKQKKDKTMVKEKKVGYFQRILFGSPGTGKSHRIDNNMLVALGIKEVVDGKFQFIEGRSEDLFKTVFHPEYTYGDFVGKLLPITKEGKVEYRFCSGDFLKALGKAYKNIIESSKDGSEPQKVALVIDEINRANSSAVFGTVFQLLDREDDGWSSYSIDLSELEVEQLFSDLGIIRSREGNSNKYRMPGVNSDPVLFETFCEKLCEKLDRPLFTNREVKIPPNLSIIGSMNTSDNSIYFMDSAFKRRWQWEFVDWDDESFIPESAYSEALNEEGWKKIVRSLNNYLKSKHEYIRGIEDKQIGHYFIKEWTNGGEVSDEFIRNKLMFFVWDSVFQRDKKPLLELINKEREESAQLKKSDLVTFGDFCRHHNEFVNALLNSAG